MGAAVGVPGAVQRRGRVLNKSVLLKHELGDMVGIAYCLEIHGWLAVRAGRYVRAAWLLGGADALWKVAGGRLGGTAALESVHASSIAAGQTALGTSEFGPWLEAAGEPEPPAAAVPGLLWGAGGPVAWISPGFTRLGRLTG